MEEHPCTGYDITIEIARLHDDGETLEECRSERFATKALVKCPECGWLNYTAEDWDDDPLVCENPACNRARVAEEEEYGEASALYVYCRPCERWYHEALFPRHLLTAHCRLHSPDDDPYNIIPGQEAADLAAPGGTNERAQTEAREAREA